MNIGSTSWATPSDNEIVLTRTFGGPRERVFEALTSAEHLPHWFGPPIRVQAACARSGKRRSHMSRTRRGRNMRCHTRRSIAALR